MSYIHAKREDNGRRVLVEIECDGCDATIKPHPEITESGWTQTGVHYGPGHPSNGDRSHWCPRCTANR